MIKPDRSNYTPLDFLEWDETKTLVLTPKFQRRGVWTDGARSSLIDTILRGMPVPPIYLRVRQSDDKKRIVREVIDGQQRIASVLKYLRNELRLSKALGAGYAGRRFKDLGEQDQDQIRQFAFNCEIFQGIADKDILEIFARLNTYSIPLNHQELRNGRYFGFFKQTAYSLAYQYVEFWRKHSIFSERSIARMLEVELTSELIIAQLDGLQDKKKSIDTFYQDYDETFTDRRQIESKFRSAIDAIEESVGETLEDSDFRRPPLFYSLFCAVYHRMFGLPRVNASTPKRALGQAERASLSSAIAKLSEIIDGARENPEHVPTKYSKFVAACLRQTDNLEPRRIRLESLLQEAF